MAKISFTPLKNCNRCGEGIGKNTFKCESVIPGEFCSTDCYANTVAETFGFKISKEKSTLKTDGHGGVYLE